jgi:hypothetical protein
MQHVGDSSERTLSGTARGRVTARGAGLLGIAWLASACSGSGDDTAITATPQTLQPAGSEQDPLYVVGHTVYSPDSANTYLTVLPSLAGDVAPDLSRSLEIGGAAVPYGIAGSGKVFVSSQEAGTMTEVTFDEQGAPAPGRVISFANVGITDTWGLNIFLSPTKAYHISQSTFDVVVWNPEEMTVTGSFATGLGIDAPNDSRVFIRDPIFVDDQVVLVSGQWADYTPADVTSVTVIDTLTDAVVSDTTESRCHSLLAFAADAAGDRYFISNSLGATGHLTTPGLVPAPCMLRMRSGDTAFDPGWSRSLTADLGTSLWTGIAPGAGGAQNTTVMTVDGRSYMTADNGTSSDLVETTFAGAPRSGLEVPGYIWNVIRIR